MQWGRGRYLCGAGWCWEEGAENISCQPSLVTVIGGTVEDQAHYKETFFSYGKMYENLKGQAVC